MTTPITTIPNRPAGKPVFDFQIAAGYARVVLSTVSNDGARLVLTGWAYQIDAQGVPLLDGATAAPIATVDTQRVIELSGILAGTHALYDGWCRYTPEAHTTVNADNLPAGWISGSGAPSGAASYGAGYYDLDSGACYTYQQGCLNLVAQSYADSLDAQIDTAAKLANLGI